MRPRPATSLRGALAPALFVLALCPPAARAAGRSGIALDVDASQVTRRLVHVHETLAVKTGPLALSYPKWIPGDHAPDGPVVEMAGLSLRAAGAELPWRRDDVDLYTVRVTVPAGADRIEADFDVTYAADASELTAGTGELVVVNWNEVLLYVADGPVGALPVRARLVLPHGWRYGTALRTASAAGDTLAFEQVSLATLVDSPVLAGAHFRHLDLAAGTPAPYALDMACDGEAGLAVADSDVAGLRRLVREAETLFGGHHHSGYRFLVTLSDHVPHDGLEHHESSDDRTFERTWLDADLRADAAGLLPHELAHSWNGKYRRPAGLATPDYQVPMKDELLWVYEGLTEYAGWLLTARSGIDTPDEALERLAIDAARMEAQRGRQWRPLADTAIEASLLYGSRHAWSSWRRGTDFYGEGMLVWLEVDVTIRRLTRGARSLDDFCRMFCGGTGPAEVKPYVLRDVVNGLDAVAPWDWSAFLHARVDSVQAHAPMGGITGAGWSTGWSDTMPEFAASLESAGETLEEPYSIGVRVDKKSGDLVDVIPGSAAARAGLAPEMTLVAVNGRRWDEHVLRDAIRASASGAPLELLVQDGEFYHAYTLDYRGGLRYPVLRREGSTPDVLSDILRPHAAP